LVVQARWPAFLERLDVLAFADQMIFRHLNPDLEPEEFRTATEINAEHIAASRAHWSSAPAEGRCPVVKPPHLFAALDALGGCPVVDSVAAAFQMSASGDPTCISPLMDLVERDPGLSAQLLIAANRVQAHADEGASPIDDPRLAVGLLGETRLVALARSLVTVPEPQLRISSNFDWPQFWSFQNGVARLARLTCRSMEFHDLEPVAFTAGMLQGLGKLLLCWMEPVGFYTVLEYARTQQIPLADVERKFLGCTTNELAVHFAERVGLPRPYVNVMRWIDTPAQATEDIELVSVVSLARDFCRHNHLGSCGDPPHQHFPALEESEEWGVLRERVFLGFNMRKFELQAHAECHEARLALQGGARKISAA
jgi:HD-like signal output (HDOD) protein